jgi:hypothetical protein
LITGLLRVVNANNAEIFIKDKSHMKEKFNYNGMPVNHPSTFVSKELYDKYGLFSLDYKNAADYELILRFMSKGIEFVYLREVLSNMRIGGSSDDYMTTFKETREININYGCMKIIAWKNYFVSIAKSYISKNIIRKFSKF